MKTMDEKRGIIKNEEGKQKLHEGSQKGNVKPANSPKPKIIPAPQKILQK